MIKPWPLTKGIATGANHMTCPPGFFIQLDDWRLEYGRWRPRFGSTIQNNSAFGSSGAIDCGIFYKDETNPTNGGVNIVQTGTKIYRSSQYGGDSGFLSSVTYTDITGTATPSASGSAGMADVLNNVLILTSLTGSPSQVVGDGSNAAPLAGSPPAAILVKVVNNFAFLAGVNAGGTNNSRVFWSAVGDPQTWPATSFVDWRTNDADYIVGLGTVGQDLFVFKNNNIGRLTTTTAIISGTATLGPMTTIFKGIGCAGYRAIDNLPNGNCVFLGSDYNLYQTDGISLNLMSKGPFGTPDIFTSGFVNGLSSYSLPGARFTASPTLFVNPTRNEIWVKPNPETAGTTKAQEVTFVYDYVQDYWRRVTGHAIGAAWRMPPVRGGSSLGTVNAPYRIFIGTNGDQSGISVVALDNESVTTPTDDNGTVINATAVFSIFDPDILGGYRAIDFPSTNSGTTTVTFGFDGTLNGSSTKTLSALTIRNLTVIPYKNLTAATRSESLQIQWVDSNSNNLIYMPYFSDEAVT